MTPELTKRLNNAFKTHTCDTCDGKGYVNGSPSNPTPSPCENCQYTGIAVIEGSTMLMVHEDVMDVLREYIKEYGPKK